MSYRIRHNRSAASRRAPAVRRRDPRHPRSPLEPDRHGLDVPDLLGVLADGAVGGEVAHPGHVEDRLPDPRPGAEERGDPLLRLDVGGEVGAVEETVAPEQLVEEGPEEPRVSPFHPRELREGLVELGARGDPALRVVAGAPKRVDLLGRVAEDEDVLGPDGVPDLDVGSVQRPDRQGAVQRRLHVPGAGGLEAGGRDLLGEVASRGRSARRRRRRSSGGRRRGAAPCSFGSPLTSSRHAVQELDDQLRHRVAGSRLPAEEDGPRRRPPSTARVDPVPEGEDVKGVQDLPLVLVDPLHLNVEQRVGIEGELELPAAEARRTGPCSRA